jgi:cephalosporin-C deacetylase-like acetyl esterase
MGCPDMSLNMMNLQKTNRENPEVFSSYWANRFERLVVLEFTRDRKCMSVFCEDVRKKKKKFYNF